jgi:hypothetical protein
MNADPLGLIPLWHVRTKRCFVTSSDHTPPFWAIIYDNDEPIDGRSFDTHNDATTFAVDQLRRNTNPRE